MATPALDKSRPISPHISIWRPTITYVMSIVHRITGAGLYFGTALLTVWLVSAASGADGFQTVNDLFGSIVGRILLFLYTWALLHHMLGGVRHFFWDFQIGMDPPTANMFGWATIITSVSLTILVWIVALIVV